MHTHRYVVGRFATRHASLLSLWCTRCWCHTPQPMPQSERVATRSVVLAHWNVVATPQATAVKSGNNIKVQSENANNNNNNAVVSEKTPSATPGKGMSFASSLLHAPLLHSSAAVRGTRKGNVIVDGTAAEVSWNVYERMDYFVQYCVPANWHVEEFVRENSVAIQCSPPRLGPESRPSLHGISVNCFAYSHAVAAPDSHKLLRVFLRRFNASVGNSLQILSESSGSCESEKKKKEDDANVNAAASSASGKSDMSAELAARLHSAVAEVTFTAAPGQPLAHGLCRAFFSSTARFHYITVIAVPEEEFAASQDLIRHALVSVTEMRAPSNPAT